MNLHRTILYSRSLAVLALGFASLAGAEQVAAQVEDSLSSLRGQVLSRSRAEPVEQAFVFLLINGKGAITDDEGRFIIPDVRPILDTVQIQYFGFTPSETTIQLEPGRVTDAVFLLSQSVLEVAELKVEIRRTMSGKMRGFEERRQKGFGYFITPEQIERRQPQRSSDILRGIPGVTVGASQPTGPAPVYFSRGSSGRCEPKIYLDGQPMAGMAFDDITAMDLMAIEIYKGATQMPAQWATGSCGLLVVWTKDGSTRNLQP
jgi:hypothetical protein